jgi:hypothetical protein
MCIDVSIYVSVLSQHNRIVAENSELQHEQPGRQNAPTLAQHRRADGGLTASG